jgi:hypothetical protein
VVVLLRMAVKGFEFIPAHHVAHYGLRRLGDPLAGHYVRCAGNSMIKIGWNQTWRRYGGYGGLRNFEVRSYRRQSLWP